jgi:imidazolonepropionase-like amidohydrolase
MAIIHPHHTHEKILAYRLNYHYLRCSLRHFISYIFGQFYCMKSFLPRIITCVIAFCVFAFSATAQETFPSNGEVANTKPECYAITNVRIVVSPTSTIDVGTLVVRKGVIEAVGAKVAIPQDAVVYDLRGKTVYPSFIEADSDYGMPVQPPPQPFAFNSPPQYDTKTTGAFAWNEALKPDKTSHTAFQPNPTTAAELRRLGFGVAHSFVHDGIARGTSTLVALGEGAAHTLIIKDRAAAQYSFQKGSSRQVYPTSLMGVIALLRQTYLDADWYKKSRPNESILPKETNFALEAWNALQTLPQIIEINGKLNLFRADALGDEFGVQYIIRTSGDEYQYVEEVKKSKAALITSLNFPLAYNLDDPLDALNVSLAEMKHWELAPTNPATLEKNGIPFALTSAGLRNRSTDFMPNLRTAIKYGLTKQQALAALTTVPAQLLRVSEKVGTLEKGKLANFLVTSGDVFDAETIIFQNWVQGKPYELVNPINADIRGTYSLNVQGIGDYTLTLKGSVNAPSQELVKNGDSTRITLAFERTGSGNLVTMRFPRDAKSKQDLQLTGWIDTKNGGEAWSGKGQDTTGAWLQWSAKRVKPFEAAKTADTATATAGTFTPQGARTVPFGEYGLKAALKQETVLIKNATVWTSDADGIQKNADVLLKGGKIAAVGKNLTEAGAKIIDGTGKHVTPGIIDEHSHIALQAINEASQSVTCEVREADVINPEDINIYRQLAGGVTSSHLLHGSANAIGGQTILIKLRWGASANEMKFDGAPPFVKFALGENVKQANWGDNFNIRFPQTRMGVEQVMVDAFTRAREYEASLKAAASDKNATPIRRDLELDALVEILNSKRFITCHSYVQSEIAMLMRVAEQFGFRVNTFTHILEGYKVADRMKAHGAAASSFSDWWSYKAEVAEAIPYNGAILHAMGVNVAFNSDDAEMARRLNQEAAKAVKYGGVSEEDALKFVTINPAKMLRVENRTGSLKSGKDADVVVWSDNPLSVYARVETTFVDGIPYYDRTRDAALREEIRSERARITQLMVQAKKGGYPTQPVPPKKNYEKIHCDTVGETGQ